MSEQSAQVFRRGRLPSRWALGAMAIAALVLLPIVSVLWLALNPDENIWPHLVATVLPGYLRNTAILMLTVGAAAAAIGTVTAWLVTMYRFPGARWLEWLLFLPLAIPAYVGAFALVDFFEFAGPLQTALRDLFGWQTARDYWFPDPRTRGGAALVLTASLYPYVYLLARAAFREQSANAYDVARSLGVGPLARFVRIALPLARPAVAAGTAIVMMETLADFGTVKFFAVPTLTTGIFSTWIDGRNLGGAAQLATLSLAVVVVLVTLEKISRRKAKVYQSARAPRRRARAALTGWRAALAAATCTLPFVLGFVLPVAVLVSHAVDSPGAWVAPGLLRALTLSLSLGAVAALFTVTGGLFMAYAVRISGNRTAALLMPVTAIGYAAPGTVLGLGLLIPVAALDHQVANLILAVTGRDPGLLLSGSAAVVVLAYVVRFFAIAQGAADAALGRIPPSLPMAARSLGRSPGGTLIAVHVPLIRASALSALLLVFVDSVKELPATLLLRPFGFQTLATRTYDQASLENIAEAAPPALLITAVGLTATLLLARANR